MTNLSKINYKQYEFLLLFTAPVTKVIITMVIIFLNDNIA